MILLAVKTFFPTLISEIAKVESDFEIMVFSEGTSRISSVADTAAGAQQVTTANAIRIVAGTFVPSFTLTTDHLGSLMEPLLSNHTGR
jgi:hypothetical protein